MMKLECGTVRLAVDARRGAEQKRAFEHAAKSDLKRSGYHPVRSVTCHYDNGVLTLRGRLPSFFLKQVAQSVVRHRLEGLVTIDNQVEVSHVPSH